MGTSSAETSSCNLFTMDGELWRIFLFVCIDDFKMGGVMGRNGAKYLRFMVKDTVDMYAEPKEEKEKLLYMEYNYLVWDGEY